MKKLVLFIFTFFFIFVSTTIRSQALSSSTAINFQNATDGQGSWSLGWEFTVNQNIFVTSLGVYNGSQGQGFSELLDIAIWNTNNQSQPIVSATVAPDAQLINFWRWTSQLQPVQLLQGQTYRIAQYTGLSGVFTGAPVGFSNAAEVNYLGGAYYHAYGSGLQYPDNKTGSGWFGPNFAYEQGGSPVPVPSSVLLLAPGLLGLIAVRRRFKK